MPGQHKEPVLPDTNKTLGVSKMAFRGRVLNLTRGYQVNYKFALKGIEQCAVEWVEEGVSIRDLTQAEAADRRKEQAKLREPLCYAELPGIVFRPCESGKAAHEMSGSLVWEAHRFVTESATA